MPASRRRPRWLPRLALLCASGLIALVLGELAVRLFDLGPGIHVVFRESYQLSENPILRYELRPGSRSGPVQVNRHGMRDREHALEKDPEVFRIACIGDSITFGMRVGMGENWCDRLEEYLGRHYAPLGPSFEVLDFAVTGYNVAQCVESLEARALAFEPDLVLYGYCLNDPQDYSFELENLRARLSAAESRYRSALLDGGRLLTRSRLYMLARYALERRSEAGRRQDSDAPDPGSIAPEPEWESLVRGTWVDYFRRLHAPGPGWRRVEDGLSRLAAIGAREGIPIHVLVFPVFRDLEAHPLEGVHAKVVAAARKRGLRALDLAGAYRAVARARPEPIRADDLHPNELGHVLAALAALQRLLGSGELPLEDRDLSRVAASGSDERKVKEAPIAGFLMEVVPAAPPEGN